MNLLALELQSLLNAPIIELDTIDSTNNYAMRLIDADTAQPGLTILTRAQTQGKGQRGRQWLDISGKSLLMSLISVPSCTLEQQFVFNAAVTVAIADVLTDIFEGWDVRIKWPNDIIVNDKKAGGILIENVLRGSTWSYSIIGVGINILQTSFPSELPFATSLRMTSGKEFHIDDVFQKVRTSIINNISTLPEMTKVLKDYNDYLYRKDYQQKFTDGSQEWTAIIKSAGSNGMLLVQLADGSLLHYSHGVAQWKWE